MSKIGRKAIELGSVKVTVSGDQVQYAGKKAQGTHTLPEGIKAEVQGTKLILVPVNKSVEANRVWGLQRALLANKIKGADQGFEKQVKIVGLGFKATPKGNTIQFKLGFSHEIEMPLPEGVTVETDKVGQLLTFKSSDKERLGEVCSKVRALRSPEPYKGTGIQYVGEVIIRKSGKAKSA